MTKTHKASGWTRTEMDHGLMRISPTDHTPESERIVMFLGRHEWANLPADDRANMDRDRVVLISGDPLPEWAQTWLEGVNRRQREDAMARMQAAIDDADDAPFRDTGW